jgi:hypothetical protein
VSLRESRRLACLACLVLSVAIAALGGCGSARASRSLWTDSITLTLDPSLGGFRSTEAAVRGVAAVLMWDFGLPLPDRVGVFVYGGRRAFQQGLIADAGLGVSSASELSEFAIGVAGRGQLLLNGGDERDEREWLRLIAHELTHVSQVQMAGGEGRGEQWLAEGMAEWVAYATLERLGVDSMRRWRSAAMSGVAAHPLLVDPGFVLHTVGTPQGFTDWHLRAGTRPAYQLSFLMADYLIGRQGLSRVKGYFEAFRRSPDRGDNFRLAFGGTLAEFEREVLGHLRAAGLP